MGLDVVTMGETMVQLNAVQMGPLRYVTTFEKHAAGAESNFAIGVVRMGLTAGWISRVGNDDFGRYVVSEIRGEGVDVSEVRIDDEAPTGIYFIQRGYPFPGKSTVVYYRKFSAASKLEPTDVNAKYIANSRLMHVTGITPALSGTCKKTIIHAVDVAKKAGVQVSFDTNLRLRLWKSLDQARATFDLIYEKCDILITDPYSCKALYNIKSPQEIAKFMSKKGPSIVAVKLGEAGSMAFVGGRAVKKPSYDVHVVDPIGAGDAFDAGFISSILKGWSIEKALQVGNICGALATTVKGDVEGIPTLDLVTSILSKEEIVLR
ncbi:MAG: PfkB family carbohydrate kinase [Candidatus Bathyarchaeia archaeon]